MSRWACIALLNGRHLIQTYQCYDSLGSRFCCLKDDYRLDCHSSAFSLNSLESLGIFSKLMVATYLLAARWGQRPSKYHYFNRQLEWHGFMCLSGLPYWAEKFPMKAMLRQRSYIDHVFVNSDGSSFKFKEGNTSWQSSHSLNVPCGITCCFPCQIQVVQSWSKINHPKTTLDGRKTEALCSEAT